jgi:monoamine oxidase
MTEQSPAPSRRDLLSLIGVLAGSTAMYLAMAEMGFAQESAFKGPPKLSKPPPGSTVLVLGAGVAGMVAAIELRDAGYTVQVLEYNDRPGGRNWTLYGGDTFTELGGATQHVQFDPGIYLNPGPWRIPYHHQGIMHYCSRLGVALEPFTQINFNAYVHSTKAYGGKPKRYRELQADFHGHVAELLAKSAQQGALDQKVSLEDREILMRALRTWGALDANYDYAKGIASSNRRGYARNPGGGLSAEPTPSQPDALHDVLTSGMWTVLGTHANHLMQHAIFQPKGGMGMIGKAMGRELGPLIQYNAKVVEIRQDDGGVTATYVDTKTGGPPRQARAQWCVNTIPTPVLSQIPMNVGAPLKAAIDHQPYHPSLKTGLQFKRRFWEQDEQIYGGITYTDMPNVSIGYPMYDYFSSGKGMLLGAYVSTPESYIFGSKSPEDRIKDALYWGSKIHPQYMQEYECGVSVSWHKVPWTLGCASAWTEETRAAHYANLCALDGRIVLAGEHASYLGGWQEGSVTSAIDAIQRIHQRVMGA